MKVLFNMLTTAAVWVKEMTPGAVLPDCGKWSKRTIRRESVLCEHKTLLAISQRCF